MTPLQKLLCTQCRQPVAVVAVAAAVYGASPLYNTACTLYCLVSGTVGSVCRLLGKFYGRKLRGPLLQRCDRAVLPCGVTCDTSTVAEMTCDRSGVNAQHAHTQKESERMGGRGVWGWAVTVCVSLTFHLIGVHFDIVWCTLRHSVVYTSTSCVPSTWSSYPKAGAKMLEKYSKRLPRLSSLCMYTSFQI